MKREPTGRFLIAKALAEKPRREREIIDMLHTLRDKEKRLCKEASKLKQEITALEIELAGLRKWGISDEEETR